MKIEITEISKIKPYDLNAKRHPKKQIRQIAASIQEFGFNQPIVVDKQGVIIVGHGRYEAAKLLDMEEVPVMVVNLSEMRAKAYRLADNKLNESEWDMKLAVEELKGLTEPLFELTGFDSDLLLEPESKDDILPASAPAITKLGDVYELGQHRLVCGDSRDADLIEKLCDERKVDMFLSDPPYNVAYVGKTKDALTIENDEMGGAEFRQFLADAFRSADNVMKKGAVFYIWHADSEGFNFRGACEDIKWRVRQCLIWNKNSMVMGRQDYHWKHEPCLYGWKDGARHLWNSDRTQTTILDFIRPTRNEEHPTMKPVELMAYQITNNTKGEDIVLDLFGGSGSTLIACAKTGRICYMSELDPKYVDVIVQRYVDFTGDINIKRNGKPITWEITAGLQEEKKSTTTKESTRKKSKISKE